MANSVFNIAKGRINELHDRVVNDDPANSALIVVLLQAAEADAVLDDYDDLAALLAAGGNTEATFTGYARKVLTQAELSATVVDDTGNTREADMPDQVWDPAGGATNNALVKFLVCYDPDTTGGTDATIVPLSHHDFVLGSTNGSSVTANIDASGYYGA